jgi:uncharacterized protein (DUF58 family)
MVEIVDRLGLFRVRAYFPAQLALRVLPRQLGASAPALARAAQGDDQRREGLHRLRQRGLGGDLREIRDHAPGDPFKQIAWKATARRRRLMVRELERDISMNGHVLVDVSGSMRAGPAGATRIDAAIELAAGILRTCSDLGDRMGLATFDSRVYAYVAPGEGHGHLLRSVERLLDARLLCDEDATSVDEAQLTDAVARYLLRQEGFSAYRAAPPAHDARWARLLRTQRGVVDTERLAARVAAALSASTFGRTLLDRPPLAQDPASARLRAYCRLVGLELPYLASPAFGGKGLGASEALGRAIGEGRAQILYLLTDGEGLVGEPFRRAVLRMRKKGHRLVVVVPTPGPTPVPALGSPLGAPLGNPARDDERDADAAVFLASLEGERERRRVAQVRADLLALGIRVVVARPQDGAALVAGRRAMAAPVVSGAARTWASGQA